MSIKKVAKKAAKKVAKKRVNKAIVTRSAKPRAAKKIVPSNDFISADDLKQFGNNQSKYFGNKNSKWFGSHRKKDGV